MRWRIQIPHLKEFKMPYPYFTRIRTVVALVTSGDSNLQQILIIYMNSSADIDAIYYLSN